MKRCAWMVAAWMLALSLGGCANLSDFTIDPAEWLAGDWFGNKKKLAGERKPIFPEGVPGVSRGVPPELVRGYQQQPDVEQDDLLTRQATGNEEPKSKPKSKPKPKVAAKPAPAPTQSRPTPITVRRPETPPGQQQPAAEQWPDPTPPRQQPGAVQWPNPPPPGAASSAGQWPDPPPTR